jgi:predicted outer membrane protein
MAGKSSDQFRWVAQMQQGGQEADRLQFEMLDQHIQMLDRALNQLKGLADKPEEKAAEIMRWSAIRDETVSHIQGMVTAFLSQRVIPLDLQQAMFAPRSGQTTPSASPSEQQEAGVAGSQADRPEHRSYTDLLQTAHAILFHANLAKQTSDDSHVQHLRKFASELKQEHQDAQRSIEARIHESGVLDRQKQEETQSASREDQDREATPGIDEAQRRQAIRDRESQGAQSSPSGSSSGNTPSTPSTPGATGGGASGSTAGGASSGSGGTGGASDSL